MAKKTLTYTDTPKGIRTAINELLDELEASGKQFKRKAKQLQKKGEPPVSPYDLRVGYGTFLEFGEIHSSRSAAGRLWGQMTRLLDLGGHDEPPLYVGDLTKKGVSKHFGGKSYTMLVDYLAQYDVEFNSTPSDWVPPDERLKEGETRPDDWATYDRQLTEEMVHSFEPHFQGHMPYSYYMKSVLWRYLSDSSEIPFGRRIYMGHLAGKITGALAEDFKRRKIYPESSTSNETGMKVWDFMLAFMRHYGVTPGSTPEGWKPKDVHE